MPQPVSLTRRQTKAPSARFGMGLHVGVVDLDRVGADGQRAAFGHGVAGIDGQVHDDLLDHAGVRLHQGQFGRRIEFERDGLAEHALEHLGQVADHLAQVERLGLHDVLAAEHEQLPGQARGAFGGKVDRLGAIQQLRRQVGPGQQHPGVALDHREHVVEIVRDAGGQLADGLHLLRLEQLGFQIKPVGDVFDVAVHHLAGGHWTERPEQGAALE